MITGAMEPAVELAPNASSGADALRAAVVSLQAERGAELWGLARHLGLSVDEADDAVQDTLLRLWSAMRDGQPIDKALGETGPVHPGDPRACDTLEGGAKHACLARAQGASPSP